LEQKQLATSLAEIVNLPVRQCAQLNCVGAPRLHENSGSPGSVYADKRFALRGKKIKKFRVHWDFSYSWAWSRAWVAMRAASRQDGQLRRCEHLACCPERVNEPRSALRGLQTKAKVNKKQ